MLKKYIGDREFYSQVLKVAIPMIVQTGISNFVNLLDNIMVGKMGTEPMNGVSIANQLFFVFYLCIFGALSGAGIFSSQFFGSKDKKGINYALKYKILIASFISISAIGILFFFKEGLCSLFIHTVSDKVDPVLVMKNAVEYLDVMLIGLIPFMLSQVFASTLKECRQTKLPMKAGVAAVLVNLLFNYILIFGHFGFPSLGAVGAAIATVISRFVELGIILNFLIKNRREYYFIVSIKNIFEIPSELVKNITFKGMPLFVNELLWSLAMTKLTQTYSLRGLEVISALNISSTISNLISIVYMSLGTCVGILVGNILGTKDYEKAKDYDTKLIAFSMFTCLIAGALMLLISPYFPLFYKTSVEIRALATKFICVVGITMPLHGFCHACYFTLRSGGKTLVTFLFDSVYSWTIEVVAATLVVCHTGLDIVYCYLIVQSAVIIKCIIGYTLVKKGVWINTLVD